MQIAITVFILIIPPCAFLGFEPVKGVEVIIPNMTVHYLATQIVFYEGLSFVRNGQLIPQVWSYRTERPAFHQNDHSFRARSVWPKAVLDSV